jgi:hypothetical protein
VDARKMNSLHMAQLENELGVVGTYNFRMVPESFDESVIQQITQLGHEIGYHYEDLALAKGNLEQAIQLFEQNLTKLRQIASIDTICMHGSPLSKYDNRKLWEKYDYRDYRIIGEPYFDVDFGKVLYLTDTGRRWDNVKFSIRDKIEEGRSKIEDPRSKIEDPRSKIQDGRRKKEDFRKEETQLLQPTTYNLNFHSTFDIIRITNNGELPAQIMLTVHPQRWEDRVLPWIRELVWQNVKNVAKRMLVLKEDRRLKI